LIKNNTEVLRKNSTIPAQKQIAEIRI